MKKNQRLLRALLQDLKDGNFKYDFRDEEPLDWHSYNLAKINEIRFVLPFIRNAVEDVCKKEERPRGKILPSDLAKIILLQQYFQKSERVMEGAADIFREKLNLNVVPSARTISRAYFDKEVWRILRKVFLATSEPITALDKSFSADSTGQPLSIKQNYANDRDDEAKHAGYDKIGVMISNRYQIATSIAVGPGTMNDAPLFEPMLLETSERFCMEDVEADAGFLSRANVQAVEDVGGTPFIYPKINVKLNQDGYPAWKKMLVSIIKRPQDWLRNYYKREQVEGYFSSYKRRFPRPLLNKRPTARRAECLARITIQNLCMLINAYFCHEVAVEFFRE